MKWTGNYLDVPTEVRVRGVSNADIAADPPEYGNRLIPKK